jgi:hypothetical protein
MYDCSRRSPNSRTNSSRSVGVRACQYRPRLRCEISAKSKMSLATLRIVARRSAVRVSFLSSGSARAFKTSSTDWRS